MSKKNKNWSRREFIKIAGAAGVGAVVSSVDRLADATVKAGPQSSVPHLVPVRPFGKTGVDVSILTLGGTVNFVSNQLLLRQALKMGVTSWDTSHNYIGGKSEKGIGKYFSKFPQDRKKVFLITKSGQTDPDNMTQHLYDSLRRMKTSYLDLFLIQAVSNVNKTINDNIRKWVENAKANGEIRFFGFSTHKKMEQCLAEGAKLGWIDGIMTTYNYRLMHTDRMKKVVDSCNEAGIGLIAMKTQASLVANLFSELGDETDAAIKLNQQFMDKGFTIEQAKLKSVWENQEIASICSHMPNMKLLRANTGAALDKTSLSLSEKQLMTQYAEVTSSGYCTGCAEMCEDAIARTVPVSDIMRYLMYYCNYADQDQAIHFLKKLPVKITRQLDALDYSKAEQCCPQGMPIAHLMKKAAVLCRA